MRKVKPAMQETKSSYKTLQALIILASFTIIVAGMQAAKSIMVPFLLALFISIIASPPYFWLQKKGIPKAISLIIVMLTFLLVAAFIGIIIGTSINDFTLRLPFYEERLQTQTQDLVNFLIQKNIVEPEFNLSNIFNPSSVLKIAAEGLNQVSGFVANGFMILLTVIFIILELTGIPNKIKKISSTPENSISRILEISRQITKYSILKTRISLITGILVYILLIILGIDYPLLWAVLAFALNFIPNIGSIIAAIVPILLAVVQYGFIQALLVLVGYVVINTIIGNIVEPRLMGKGLGLSTLVVFISLVFWGWIFGPIGMLLSVPLTITVKIALESSDETRWLAVLLGPEISDRV